MGSRVSHRRKSVSTSLSAVYTVNKRQVPIAPLQLLQERDRDRGTEIRASDPDFISNRRYPCRVCGLGGAYHDQPGRLC